MANKILNLDLSKDPDLPVFIYGRVGDEMMQTATVNITNHDQQKSLEGFVITFEGTINNKIKVFDSDNVKPIDLAKGTFEYTFPSAAFSLAGTYDRAYFSIAKGELRDTTGDFKIVVSSNADITAKEAETIITEYNRLVAKLNQEFKDSVEQMESDYSELESTIEGIKGDISELTIKINNYQENVQETADVAVETINTSVNNAIGEITQAVNKALQKLEAGDFYTKAAADTKFQGYQSTPIMAQDWNTITQPGIYYVNNATGINKPDSLVTTMYGFLEVINNQFSSNATVQRFISFNNEICTRRYSGNPITWGAWEATAKTKDVVTLAKDQEISGVKDFKDGIKIGGLDVSNNKVYSENIEIGFGLPASIKRVGKVVLLSVSAVQPRSRGDAVSSVAERIPEGFRPNLTVSGIATMNTGSTFNSDKFLAYIFASDGTMTYQSKGMNATNITVNMTVSWITDNALPG